MYTIGEGWLFLIIITLFYLSAELGLFCGRKASATLNNDARDHVATIEGALLGLLALLLGFAFSMAMSRYDHRRSVVVQEANDIQTTYLRAQLLPSSFQEEIKRQLRNYVESRIDYLQAGIDQEKIKQALAQTTTLQDSLWHLAVAAAKENSNEVTTGYFIESLNGLIDDHTNRISAMENHVPSVILLLLIFVGMLTIGMTGYSSGLNQTRLLIPRSLLIIATVATLLVIIDLDRPRRGLITISEKALVELRESLAEEVRK